MAANETVKSIAVPLLWTGVDDLPVQTSNQALAQIDQDQVFLTFGVATPPVVMGPDVEKVREQVERLNYVPVRPISRLAISRRHLGELIEILQRTAENFDRQGGNQ